MFFSFLISGTVLWYERFNALDIIQILICISDTVITREQMCLFLASILLLLPFFSHFLLTVHTM